MAGSDAGAPSLLGRSSVNTSSRLPTNDLFWIPVSRKKSTIRSLDLNRTYSIGDVSTLLFGKTSIWISRKNAENIEG